MDNKIFVVNFFVSIIPAGIIANWFYLQEQPLHRRSHPASYDVECRCGADCCRASRQGRQSLWCSSSAHAVSSRKGRAVTSRRNNTPLPATGVGDASSRRDVSALFCFYLRGFKRRQIGGTMRKFGVALAVGAC